MEENVKYLEWKKNPVYIFGTITIFLSLLAVYLLLSNSNQNFQITMLVSAGISAGVTFLLYENQCPKCKRVFGIKKFLMK